MPDQPTPPTSFPKDRISVVLLEGVHDAAARLFEAETFSVRREKKALAGEDLLEAVRGAHVLGIRSKTQIDAGVLAAAGRLLCVGCFCIGTNQVDLRTAKLAGIPVFNAPFSNTRSVAELTVAEIVMLHRRLGDRVRQMHAGEWDKSAAGAHEIRGRTLGIVGYGHIGTQVSILAEALGMRVVYYDLTAKLPLGNARACGTLEELLEVSDVVTLHVPEDRTTRGMLGAEQIRRMKPGAFLINNARGTVVDVPALAAALREGRLGGAAMDVFPDEPKGADEPFESELRGLANVILTPHIGGSTAEAQENIGLEVAGKLIRFVNNGSTAGAVNVPQVDLPAQPRRTDGAGTAQRQHRVLHFHKNVPGVLSGLHRIISDLGINVVGEYLQTDPEVGYVVLDVDPSNGNELKERLDGVRETIRTRILW